MYMYVVFNCIDFSQCLSTVFNINLSTVGVIFEQLWGQKQMVVFALFRPFTARNSLQLEFFTDNNTVLHDVHR